MINIVEHVEYLLRRHDCVIVPSIGAFLAQTMSAHIDSNAMMFVPPFRLITFNSAISHNDGLLVTSVMRRHHLSYSTALSAVEEALEVLKSRLSARISVEMGNIGKLGLSNDGKIFFSPAEESSANIYGSLPYIKLKKAELLNRDIHRDKSVEEFETSVSKSLKPYLVQSAKWAAAVVIIACIGLAMRMPLNISSRPVNYASISGQDLVAVASVPAKRNNGECDGILSIAYPTADDAVSAVDTNRHVSSAATISMPSKILPKQVPVAQSYGVKKHGNDFCLVVASLTTRKQAERFIDSDGNPELKILVQDGRYRVYLAQGNDKSKLQEMINMPHISKRYPGAWICERN